MSKLTFLNLSANGFSGPLPSPFTSTLLIGLDLSLNSFNGNLPSNWSSLTLLDFLYVNNNQLTGAVPSTWLNLQSLTQLDLSVICGLCGGVPVPRGVYIWFGGTALGYQCGTFNACAGSKNLILTTLAIGGGILAGLFVTGMVGRLIVLRLYSRSALQTQEEPEWAPTSRYLNYAQRRVQEIITQGRLPPPSPAFIPLFEVSLGEEGGAMSPSDATREPTMIPVGANKYAILVEAPGDTCLCLAHPDANEEPPAAESKKKSKRKKKGTEEDKPPVDDVEMGTLRSNPQALSSQVSPNTSNMIIPPVPRIAYPLEDTEPSPNPHSSSSNQRPSPRLLSSPSSSMEASNTIPQAQIE